MFRFIVKTVVFVGFGLIFLLPVKEAQAGWLDFFYTSKDQLTVSGNKFYFNDEPIMLRGLAVGDPHSREKYDRRTESDYLQIRNDWQANVVRISIHPGVFRRDQDEGLRVMEKEIKAARDNGLIAVVDWHVIGFPNGWYQPDDWGADHYYSYESDFNSARDFWKSMAVKYRGDRGVVFEIWNEPADRAGIKWEKLKPYLQQLIDMIRANGAENTIVASGIFWTYDLRDIKNSPLSGSNIAYSWHVYPGSNKSLSWDSALNSLNKKYPILVSEWGFNTDPGANSHHYSDINNFPVKFRSYLLNNYLHFTAWCWHGNWKPNMFRKNWQDLTDFGQFAKNFLRDYNEIILINKRVNDFVKYGIDVNSRRLGEGERMAVVTSFQLAFGRTPSTMADFVDILAIANGNWPKQRSQSAENRAKTSFRFVYLREPDMNNKYDNAAITVMAYGLRQRAENRNLNSERNALLTYKSLYRCVPSDTAGWNILQAITYSGARR